LEAEVRLTNSAYISQIFAPIITFAVFVTISHNQGDDVALDTARVYTALSIFALMTDPITTLVISLSSFAGSVGSFTRIQEFLQKDALIDTRQAPSINSSSDELIKDAMPNVSEKSSIVMSDATSETKSPRSQTPSSSADIISVHNCDFGWDPEKEPLLKSITMTVADSKLSMIVGPVGCGKSTLLKAILGEISPVHGSVYMGTDQIAYCDQTAWHVNDTIRNSIIAASEFDEQWYSTVLHACALHEDLRQLPQGDQTMIGSKGVALSGGQGQRIVSCMLYVMR
jgi:ATP-binding cassette, subfamily C (CFTR/MRP), member 1